MGCCHSRLESKEAVSRCKARRRYMRQLSVGRQAFAAAHSLYLHFLRSTGAALLQFADAESRLQLQPLPPPPRPPPPPSPPRPQPPPPPFSPSSDNWASSVTASPILPPPPPPPPSSSAWDFWDPFAPSSSHSVTEEEWEEAATTVSEVAAAPAAAPPPSVISGYSKDSSTVELAVVSVPRGKKSISEIVKELDVYFLKASETGQRVSIILESPNCGSSSSSSIHGVSGKMSSYCKSFNPMLWSRSSSPKASDLPGFKDSMEEMGRTSHSSTIEKLYAWEKKLYLEVKNCERTREEKEKRLSLLRRQEAKGADYFKVEKNKREIERLESKLMVSCQAIEATSSEIIRLREVELFPQLLDLVNGLMFMWRGMYECHQVQTHIVQQLEYLNNSSSTSPTSDLHRQATLQLEAEVEHWYSAFCNLIKSQRDYIHALTGWLRLSLFQCHHKQLDKTQQNPEIYALCEDWQLSLDRVPDKVASEGIKSFLTVIHAVVMQQAEELRQKKRSDSSFKELEKRDKELRSLECKYGPYSSENYGDNSGRSAVMEKKAKVDALKTRAEEEKTKYEKSSGITRAMTMNNLQTGFPNVFQAMTGFSSVCVQTFGALYSHRRSSNIALNFNRLLT